MTLKGYWPLHDGKNGKAKDYSGNNNHGTLNGGVTTGVAGRGGLEAMSFDGNDDKVLVEHSSSISMSELTISAWIKPKITNSGDTIARKGDNFSFYIAGPSRQEDNGTLITYNGSTDAISLGKISQGIWSHVSVVITDNTTKFYINGSLDSSESQGSGSLNSNDLLIGNNTSSGYAFDGVISDARIYSRALAQQEIQQLYQMGSADIARPRQDGIARYPLDGGSTDIWNLNNGDNVGVSFVDDAIRGKSGSFDRSNEDYIQTSASGNFGTGSFSISVWAKPNGSGKNNFRAFVGTSDGDNAGWVARIRDTGELQFYIAGSYIDGPKAEINDWGMYTYIRREDGSVEVYKNGIRRKSGSIDLDVNSPYEIEIGARGDTVSNDTKDSYGGLIDDVRIYDYALEPHEVFELYRWGTRGKDLRKHLINRRGI